VKAWRARRDSSDESTSARVAGRWLLTYLFVCSGWILFRAPTLDVAWTIIRKIFGDAPGGVTWFFIPLVIVGALVVGRM
jgi:D-alanyl-lipoteichoic acid acyltransferase DltB (MBOAT superfamily)